MKMKSIVTLFGAALLSFGAVSCDSPREDAREDALENKADAQENAADAVRENAEQKADNLEEAADATRDQQ